MEITKSEFKSYEQIRRSGVTNMFDVRTVSMLSGLNKEKIVAIMKQYSQLSKRYPSVRET